MPRSRSIVAVLVGLLALAALDGCAAPATRDAPPAVTPAATAAAPAAAATTTVRFTPRDALRLTPEFRVLPTEPVELSGELHVPAGRGPFPVVLLMHGCAGPSVVDRSWAVALNANGLAAFRVDSFAGRGIGQVCADAFQLTPIERIPDAYGALAALAGQPRIDRGRAALMGFSHGGLLTLGASTAWARERYGAPDAPSFRAFVALYPTCNFVFPERLRLAAPLRIHVGELDDWTPAAACAELVRDLKSNGQNAELTVYRGAHHGFDAVGVSRTTLRDVDNPAACSLRAPSVLGPLLDPATLRGCMRKGATIGWDPDATAEARRIVLDQLAGLLR